MVTSRVLQQKLTSRMLRDERLSRLDLDAVADIDLVDDPDDGDLVAHVLPAPDRGARSAAEGDDDRLADPGAEHVGGDDRRTRGVARERDRPHEEEPDPLERLLLLGRPDLPHDAADEHLSASF